MVDLNVVIFTAPARKTLEGNTADSQSDGLAYRTDTGSLRVNALSQSAPNQSSWKLYKQTTNHVLTE